MQKIRFLATVLGACLASAICSRADVVTQPLRKFGLGDLLQVAISPDRQWMATAGSGGAFIWDFADGSVVHRLETHLSNPQSGSVEREFFGHTSWLLTAVFSPDGQRVATGAQDGTASRQLRTFKPE
jgi:WD40 repeat protein